VLPGVIDRPPRDPADVPPLAKAVDPLAIQPLTPPLKSIRDVVTKGQPLLALDGGVGIEHLALTRSSLADGLPEVLTVVDRIPERAAVEIEAWREADGPLGGRDPAFGVVPLVTYSSSDSTFGVAKVLKSEKLTVHLRLYSDSWAERPATVNPWALRLDPPGSENPGVGHVAVSAFVYGSINAQYLRLAMVGQSELEGYSIWKADGGGKLGMRDVWGSRPPGDDPRS
jgi:hypothetical protein